MNSKMVGFVEIIYLSIAAAVITLTITRGSIFQRPRKWLKEYLPTLGALFSCPYCLTHWVCFCFAGTIIGSVHHSLVMWLVMVGISTVFMGIIWFFWGLLAYKKGGQNGT